MVTGLMTVYGMIYPWIFVITLILTVLSTIFLILDVENEMDIENSKLEPFDELDTVLEIKE